ncbi:hypothetical protein EIP91_004416 [Steccherinum ochraceum]|uniref:F-box domain-containing protein n=1 Tax=Steccherinum ochraceum TaxID=92696 RepID=A0A4R0RUH3_9APHY|nr:hypothetical protein EIP91_004416 [Steccherinum ochraceum]
MSKLDWLGYGTHSPVQYTNLPALSDVADILQHTLAIIRTIQNAECPVNRLPVEVLGNVFHFTPIGYDLGDSFPLQDRPDEYVCNPYNYLALQHVCRYWRRTLDLQPAASSTILLQKRYYRDKGPSAALVDHWLERSNTVPFTVYISVLRHFEVIAKQSGRLKRLHVYLNRDKSNAHILAEFRKLDQPAPLLESLEIDIADDDSSNLPLLFGGDISRLRKVRLAGIMSWQVNQFRGLTHLWLEGFLYEHSEELSVEPFQHLMDTLRDCPDLEEFHLECPHPWIPDWTEANDDRPQIVGDVLNLRKLHQLALRSPITLSQARSLFQYLHIPPGAVVSIVGPDIYLHQHVYQIISEHPEHFDNLDGPLTVTVQADEYCAITIEGPSGRLFISPSSRIQSDSFSAFNHIQTFPFRARVQELVVIGSPDPEETVFTINWRQVLASLPSLAKLHILDSEGMYNSDVLRILMFVPITASAMPNEVSLPCPLLRDFRVSQDVKLEYDDPRSFLYDLLACAAYRHKHGQPLRIVKVEPYRESALETAQDNVPARMCMLGALGSYIESVEFVQG